MQQNADERSLRLARQVRNFHNLNFEIKVYKKILKESTSTFYGFGGSLRLFFDGHVDGILTGALFFPDFFSSGLFKILFDKAISDSTKFLYGGMRGMMAYRGMRIKHAVTLE